MEANGTRVYVSGGGFDVRNCPDPEQLASDIVRACNAHDALVAALDAAIEQITAQLVHGEVTQEGWQSTLDELVAAQKGGAQ